MICLHCGSEFEAKRASSKYCSPSCRVAFNRRVSVTDKRNNVTVRVSVTGRFEDLPPDVQKSIEYMSRREGIDYEEEKALRTKRAWDYLEKFPERWYPYGRGVKGSVQPLQGNTAKPGDPDYPQECYGGLCQTCGAETEIKTITKCRKCVA